MIILVMCDLFAITIQIIIQAGDFILKNMEVILAFKLVNSGLPVNLTWI